MLPRSPTNKWWPVYLLVAYTCMLLLGTHAPAEPLPTIFAVQDKIMHIGGYGVLAFIAFMAATARGWFPAGAASSAFRCALIVIMATGIFGALDEATQYFVPGRIVDLLDWFADLIGCVAGSALFGWLLARK